MEFLNQSRPLYDWVKGCHHLIKGVYNRLKKARGPAVAFQACGQGNMICFLAFRITTIDDITFIETAA